MAQGCVFIMNAIPHRHVNVDAAEAVIGVEVAVEVDLARVHEAISAESVIGVDRIDESREV